MIQYWTIYKSFSESNVLFHLKTMLFILSRMNIFFMWRVFVCVVCSSWVCENLNLKLPYNILNISISFLIHLFRILFTYLKMLILFIFFFCFVFTSFVGIFRHYLKTKKEYSSFLNIWRIINIMIRNDKFVRNFIIKRLTYVSL